MVEVQVRQQQVGLTHAVRVHLLAEWADPGARIEDDDSAGRPAISTQVVLPP